MYVLVLRYTLIYKFSNPVHILLIVHRLGKHVVVHLHFMNGLVIPDKYKVICFTCS